MEQKKVFYLSRYHIDPNEKVTPTKFVAQIKAFEQMDFDVTYIGVIKNKVMLINKETQTQIAKIPFYRFATIRRLTTYHGIYKGAKKFFKKQNADFSLIYIRLMPVLPALIGAVKKMKKHNKRIAVEIPTFPPIKEASSEKRFLVKLVYNLSAHLTKRLAKHVDLFAAIGEKADQYLGTPVLNIENGAYFGLAPLRTPCNQGEEIRLLALAKMARWHGYDRLITGLNEYLKNGGDKKFRILFVGSDSDGSLAKWEQLTDKLNLNEYIDFCGAKYGEELDEFINTCDIGVASLGIYRLGYDSICVLKIREYMCRGIPFIYATNDPDVDHLNGKYCLKFENDDSFIDFEKIAGFAEKVINKPELYPQMRDYAYKNMTWEKQYRRIIDWFDQNGF